MFVRVLLGATLALASAGAGGCGGGANSHTATQVEHAFEAEGIRLIAWHEGSSDEDDVTAFRAEGGEITVAVTASKATAERSVHQLAVLTGQTESGDILRVGNVLVAFGRATPGTTKAAARRAIEHLRG